MNDVRASDDQGVYRVRVGRLPACGGLARRLFNCARASVCSRIIRTCRVDPRSCCSFGSLLFRGSSGDCLFSRGGSGRRRLVRIVARLCVARGRCMRGGRSVGPSSSAPGRSTTTVASFYVEGGVPSLPRTARRRVRRLAPCGPTGVGRVGRWKNWGCYLVGSLACKFLPEPILFYMSDTRQFPLFQRGA